MRPNAAVLLLVASVVITACARQPAAGEPPAPEAAEVPTAVRGGVIITERVDTIPAGVSPDAYGVRTDEEIAAIAPRVAGLLPSPSTFIIRVGDTVRLRDALRLTVFDSSGAGLGELPRYDVLMDAGAAVLQRGNAISIRGVRPGSSLLWLSYPRDAWGGRGGKPVRIGIPVMVVAP